MSSTYRRLTIEERDEIAILLAKRHSLHHIARVLGRSPSTLSREVRRNRSKKKGYRSSAATLRSFRRASFRRRGKTKLQGNSGLLKYVLFGLQQNWSPQQIVRRLQMEYSQDESMRVSHETIYKYIYVLPRGELRKELTKALREERKYRRKRKSGKDKEKPETRGKIANMISIVERPKEVADRTVPGHWEGDLILGRYKRSALGTLVERVTRYTLLVPLGDKKDAESVRKAYAKALKRLPKDLAKTLTYDQGKEMSQHEKFTVDTGIQVYFADPASPWQRGTNENTNRLVRQYFPKGTDFTKISTREIKRVERQLNGRPRQVLEFYKPCEVFNELVALNS